MKVLKGPSPLTTTRHLSSNQIRSPPAPSSCQLSCGWMWSSNFPGLKPLNTKYWDRNYRAHTGSVPGCGSRWKLQSWQVITSPTLSVNIQYDKYQPQLNLGSGGNVFSSLKWRIEFQNGKLSLVFCISEIVLALCVFSFAINTCSESSAIRSK